MVTNAPERFCIIDEFEIEPSHGNRLTLGQDFNFHHPSSDIG
jgi:hypothetical protein